MHKPSKTKLIFIIIALLGLIILYQSLNLELPRARKQSLCLDIINNNAKNINRCEYPESLRSFDFFCTPDFKYIQDHNDISKYMDKELLVYNPNIRVSDYNWVAIYIGNNWETRLKGYLVLWSNKNTSNKKIERIKDINKLVKNNSKLEYYLAQID